ncbi:ScbR family autoregulator-binding transcription factor [Streptacidiphilus albus]|uniref:ScbR family autoregulator-binding transcription factor n=1 Tax=Streptacidiphilus albus TaxID=105425 RepID=UPI00054B354A|nr:ScbR family autoregulator-binding transcription factor [Streptacidiphilus albus]
MAPTPTASPVATASGRPPKALKQERARNTRRTILDAAAQVFAEKGFAAMTLQDVAERAGLTKGALYFHFSNKESLAVEIVNIYLERWQPLIDSVEQAGLSPLETLVEILDRTAEVFRTEVPIQAAARLQIERSLIHADVPTPYVGWIAVMTELAEQAKEAGELREGLDPAVAARVIVSSFFGMQHMSDMLSARADQRERYREMCDVLLLGIRA